MIKFSANISMLFTEVDFLDRFAAARDAGFSAVEITFPYAWDIDAIQRKLEIHGLDLVLIAAPPGNIEAGDRGFAAVPGRESEFDDSIDTAIKWGQALGCSNIHVMAGVAAADDPVAGDTYVANLQRAAAKAAHTGQTILVEPINTRDMPGYYLSTVHQARTLRNRIDHNSVRLQFDTYHCQMMTGDVARQIEENIDWIGHFQIAGVPGRHEPDVGEINYAYLFDHIERLGYRGWIGAEYKPQGLTAAGLGWFARFRSGVSK